MSSSEQQLQRTGDGAPAPARQPDFTPRSMQELQQFAKTVSQSAMVPKKYRGRPQDVVVAVMHGMELGLPPLQALQSVAVINGRPSIYGDAALAVVRRSGLLADIDEWTEGGGEDMIAFCKVRRADTGEEIQQTFSWEEAEQAGLAGKGGPWQDYPRRMMQMRARSWCLRDAFPEVLKGMMLAEEAEAIPKSNGETIDPRDEMNGSEDAAGESVSDLHEWKSPTGDTFMLTGGKVGSLSSLAKALEEETSADLGAKIGATRDGWEWSGDAGQALEQLLTYHEQRLADEVQESAEDAAAEGEQVQDADEVKEAADSVDLEEDEPKEFQDADADLPF